MKRISLYSLMFAGLLSFGSCSLFQLDNYDEPKETLTVSVVDKNGDPVLTDRGSEGIRVRLIETSWTGGSVTPMDFECGPDGIYTNTKLFEADYNVSVDGPFLPIVLEDNNGTPLRNDSKDIHLKGKVEVEFEVEPFLYVEFVGDPTVSDGVISVRVKVTRGVSESAFKDLISRTGDYQDSYLNMTDIQLFVSQSSSVGYRARDTRWSNSITYSGSAFSKSFGTPVVITSNAASPIPSGRKVYVRAAARINYDTPRGTGTKRWNYSEPVEVWVD